MFRFARPSRVLPSEECTSKPTNILLRRLAYVSCLLALPVLAVRSAKAQSLTVLHTFTGPDGLAPYSGVTMDRGGNLYGTTYGGGASGLGTVYELKRHSTSYLHSELHAFTAGNGDGGHPYGGEIFGPDGALYGATHDGGAENAGIVYSLRPPPSFCRTALCPWTEPLKFNLSSEDSVSSFYGNVAFDQSGNLYGTTGFGGISDYGTVYELSRSGNGWTGSAIYKFQADDLQYPGHNVIVDSTGNLYGTASGGALGEGGVFELSHSGSGWTETVLATFGPPSPCTGGYPLGGVIMDGAGNLFGATTGDGTTACVYELTPSGGSWQMTVLYTFTFSNNSAGPVGNMVLDDSGNLYGTTEQLGAFGKGNVFKLARSGNGWTYTDLYDFRDSGDGEYPTGDLIIDSEGNLYGTNQGDQSGHGVVWELTP